MEIVTTARGSGTTRPEGERIEGKEYEVKEHTRKAGGDKEILVDVYICIKEPKKTIIATVDVVKQEVIGINETSSWISIPER